MSDSNEEPSVHDLEVTVWVGKGGIESAAAELDTQLKDRDRVKVRLLRSARGENDPEVLAGELADAVDATVHDVRGFTTVIGR